MSVSCSNASEGPQGIATVDWIDEPIPESPEMPIRFKTEVDDLFEKLMACRRTDLMWILQQLQKKREDLLILMAFGSEFFDMPPSAFKDFKEWITETGIMKPAHIIQECLANLKVPPPTVPEEEEAETSSNARSTSPDFTN